MINKASRQQVYIVHYHPIEQYPPVMNLLNIICSGYPDKLVTVVTSAGRLSYFRASNTNVRIVRCGMSDSSSTAFYRYINYLVFYVKAVFILLVGRPSRIMYFEALSFLPVYIYKLFKKCETFCHYHEYVSPEEYRKGMLLDRINHHLEKKLYSEFSWISHTNDDRMAFFLRDNPDIDSRVTHILPNFPPASWYNFPKPTTSKKPSRIIYVGAISLENIYIRELAEWVEAQNGRVTWDLYSTQDPAFLLQFLDQINAKHIRYRGSADYFNLPTILSNYHIGVILYKGHSLNYVFNAPNKLFEYLALGLQVWYPNVMKGIKHYQRLSEGNIVEVNFENLANFRMPCLNTIKSKDQAVNTAEIALGELINELFF